jgi:Derlin-2/3
MADILNEIRKIPPVTRFLVGSSVSITMSAIMRLISPYKLLFISRAVFNDWEVRLIPLSSLVFGANGR